VRALAVYDSGNGPELYAAGNFTQAGENPATNIARWNGAAWLAVPGVPEIRALVTFDAGGGPALYAGGQTPPGVRRWNGSSWTNVGSFADEAGPCNDSAFVESLTVFDAGNGSGSSLYAGGSFDNHEGSAPNHVARWTGTSWASVGGGIQLIVVESDPDAICYLVTTQVRSIKGVTLFDGPALFVGGDFAGAGSIPSINVARWGCPPEVVLSPDLDGSGLVDGADLGQLLLAWGDCPAQSLCIADLNGDQVVDSDDLAVLLLNFGS
jgi:hypothetical protein